MATAPLDATARFGDGVAARLTTVARITATGNGPGEISGPGVAITVEVANSTTSPVAVNDAVMTVADRSNRPATAIDGSPTSRLTGTVASGGTARGVYAFTLADPRSSAIIVHFTYAPGHPVVQFSGDFP